MTHSAMKLPTKRKTTLPFDPVTNIVENTSNKKKGIPITNQISRAPNKKILDKER